MLSSALDYCSGPISIPKSPAVGNGQMQTDGTTIPTHQSQIQTQIQSQFSFQKSEKSEKNPSTCFIMSVAMVQFPQSVVNANGYYREVLVPNVQAQTNGVSTSSIADRLCTNQTNQSNFSNQTNQKNQTCSIEQSNVVNPASSDFSVLSSDNESEKLNMNANSWNGRMPNVSFLDVSNHVTDSLTPSPLSTLFGSTTVESPLLSPFAEVLRANDKGKGCTCRDAGLPLWFGNEDQEHAKKMLCGYVTLNKINIVSTFQKSRRAPLQFVGRVKRRPMQNGFSLCSMGLKKNDGTLHFCTIDEIWICQKDEV